MIRIALGAVALGACLPSIVRAAPSPTGPPKLRVLVVTGGHDFERPAFKAMWDSFEGIAWREVTHPDAHASFSADAAALYDVLVFYDMHQTIDDAARADLVALLRRGKGLVVLHHALANYQEWDEALRIVGGRFRLAESTVGETTRPPSTYKHDVPFRVRVADRRHPVTRGISDFDIVDETYGDFDILPTAKPLLTTDEPTSGPVVAWAHRYGRSDIATIQLGHGAAAYENAAFRRLLSQAIRWTARSSRKR